MYMDQDAGELYKQISTISGQTRKTTERDNYQLCQMSKGDARLNASQVTFEYNKYSEVKLFD